MTGDATGMEGLRLCGARRLCEGGFWLRKKLRKSAVKSLKEFDRVNLCASIPSGPLRRMAALQSLLHRARDLPDALLDQRRRLADVSDGLAAIVENAKIP